MLDLPLIFALTVAFSVGLYVVLDGFDLGIGILFLLAADSRDRDVMMNSVGPVWDGNETWLVMGGVLLFAAFPLVYAVVLPALYAPLMAMLFALIFRGVAFEFRFRARRFRAAWDWAFSLGSGLAALMQGLMLGAFIDGIAVRDGHFAGGTFSFLSPFAVACAFGVVAGYALLGAVWLIYKTEGTTQSFARMAAPWALAATLVFIGIISIWTPLTHPAIAQRWFSLPDFFFLSPVPLVTAALAFGIWRSVPGPHDGLPFLLSIGLALVAYAGLGVSLWPYAIPESVTIWEAAGAPDTLIFLGVGTAAILPLTLAYLGYAYWTFRGKAGSGYGH
ncbi:MAG TPA: cytochrome d ubiquinol oxidase subunit II [Micropepsaceae bacterium]|nr:cytochrome d ubiquinol oxidase subunit II [Micropepsaceae bacterium]